MKKLTAIFLTILILITTLTACSGENVQNSDMPNSTTSSSTLQTPSPSPTPALQLNISQFDTSIPHVYAIESFAVDSVAIGTQDNTLSFPVYHSKYGSYVFVKKTYDSYTINDLEYIGFEFEDNIVRFINKDLVNDGFGFHVSVTNDPPPDEYAFEELYFKGCMTANMQIDTVFEVTSLHYSDNLEPTTIEFWEHQFFWAESEKDLMLKTEQEIFDYLLTTKEFENYQLVNANFGAKALYNPDTKSYVVVWNKKQRNINPYKNIVELKEYTSEIKNNFVVNYHYILGSSKTKKYDLNLVTGEVKVAEFLKYQLS